MDVTSCPRCASPDIRQATTSDGAVAGSGELLMSVCHRCGFSGAPLRFDDEAAYQKFRVAVHSDGTADETEASEEVPAELQEILDLPAPRPSRFTSVFMGTIGVTITLSAAALLALQLLGLAGFSLLAGPVGAGYFISASWIGILMALLGLGIGVAFLRGARRLWGASPPPVLA